MRYFENENLVGATYRMETTTIGHYCSREDATPLLGKIHSLFLPQGNIFVVLYSFRPHFNINLFIHVKQSKCEGLVNTFAMFCINPRHIFNTVVTTNYIVNCNYNTVNIRIILVSHKCIVFQYFDSDIALHHKIIPFLKIKIYTFNSINTSLSLIGIPNVKSLRTSGDQFCRQHLLFDWEGFQNFTQSDFFVPGKLYFKKTSIDNQFLSTVSCLVAPKCEYVASMYFQLQMETSNKQKCNMYQVTKKILSKQFVFKDFLVNVIGNCFTLNVPSLYQGVYVVTILEPYAFIRYRNSLTYYLLHSDDRCFVDVNNTIYFINSVRIETESVRYRLTIPHSGRLIFTDFANYKKIIFDNQEYCMGTVKVEIERVYTTSSIQLKLENKFESQFTV